MGNKSSRLQKGATIDQVSELKLPQSAPASPNAFNGKKNELTTLGLTSLDPVGDDRPSTVNENWRATPRAPELPGCANDPAESTPEMPTNTWNLAIETKPGDVPVPEASTASNSASSAGSTGMSSPSRTESRGNAVSAVDVPEVSTRLSAASKRLEPICTPPVPPVTEQAPVKGPASEAKISEDILASPQNAIDAMKLAQEAFGLMIASSLTSPKWDRRAEAIKGIESMIKSHSLAAQSRVNEQQQVVVAVRLLELVLCDKIWPVFAASLGLYKAILAHSSSLSDENRGRVFDLLLPLIALRLGDTNARIHDAAAHAILASAETEDGAAACIRVLCESVRTEREQALGKTTKAFSARLTGCLDAFLRILRERGACTEEAADQIIPSLQLAVEHSKEKVRSLGLDIIVEFCQAGLEDNVRPRVTMRQAVDEALVARLGEMEEGDGEELVGDFCIVGTKAPIVGLVQEVQKPELDFEDAEEAFMDDILDATGVAFMKSDQVHDDLNHTQQSVNFGMSGSALGKSMQGANVDELEDDFLRDLEELGNADGDEDYITCPAANVDDLEEDFLRDLEELTKFAR